MEIGATFPQTEIGTDPLAIRDNAQAVQEPGYSHASSLKRVYHSLTPPINIQFFHHEVQVCISVSTFPHPPSIR
jgi:hypothetical protein